MCFLTVFDNYVPNVEIDGGMSSVKLKLWDTTCQEDYDRVRPLTYPHTNMILTCFSVELPDSYNNVMEKCTDNSSWLQNGFE